MATYGATDDFPAFYCRKSGSQVPYNVRTAKQAASIIKANRQILLRSGMLFAVPVPEEHAMDEDEMASVIDEALASAEKAGITGKNLTPFLLERVTEATGGRSLDASILFVFVYVC